MDDEQLAREAAILDRMMPPPALRIGPTAIFTTCTRKNARYQPNWEKLTFCFCARIFERGALNGVAYIIAGGGSYLDHKEKIVKDWPHMTLGGSDNVPGTYRRQSARGVLGPPEAIAGGLFSHYLLVHVTGKEMKIETLGFNADGSPIGVVDSIALKN